MKRISEAFKLILASIAFLIPSVIEAQDMNPCQTGGQTCYFGVEINGILSGYSVDTYCTGVLDGKDVGYEYSDVTLKMSLLDTEMDGGFRILCIIDKSTDWAIRIEMDVINGPSVLEFNSCRSGDTIFFESPTSGLKKSIAADSSVIFNSLTRYPHLFVDFIRSGATERRYRVYDALKGEIVEKGYSRKAEEELTIKDSLFNCLVLEETDFATGVRTLLWLNEADGFNVRTEVAGRKIFLADKSVTGKITFANLDSEFFVSTGRIIPDIPDLNMLRVQARINSYGEELTASSLNIPGQSFTGTVNGSLIEGIFEIEPVRYKGDNAPSFPPDFSEKTELKRYLVPEALIESDDPLIISEAAKITSGAKDSWEASVRLSRWVAENIAGALPGGISAINSLRTGEAECGGHSRLLAALCRASGIPARLAVGCMYTNYHSGGFGQHAWTEVYMGDAGWIPVDATISEFDYIDAGHIRLGEKAYFRPVSMEILDLRSGSSAAVETVDKSFTAMAGSFINIEQYRMFKIVNKDGILALDIPGRAVLQLDRPDDEGRIFPKLTREISLEPQTDVNGEVNKIMVREYKRLKKVAGPETREYEPAEEYRDLTGRYQLPDRSRTLDVIFNGDVMETQIPEDINGDKIHYIKNGNRWSEEGGDHEIVFIANSENQVIALVISSSILFVRGEPVTNAVKGVIRISGVKAGLEKYDEIKGSGNSYYQFSVHMLHDLGHMLLKEDKLDDAIAVFLRNVKEYPRSFMANDALAEAYLKKGDGKYALRYFRAAVKLNPEYEYGKEMIEKLKHKIQ